MKSLQMTCSFVLLAFLVFGAPQNVPAIRVVYHSKIGKSKQKTEKVPAVSVKRLTPVFKSEDKTDPSGAGKGKIFLWDGLIRQKGRQRQTNDLNAAVGPIFHKKSSRFSGIFTTFVISFSPTPYETKWQS